MGEFCRVDARLIFRTVAIETKEYQRPQDAQQREKVKDPAPAPCVHDHNGNQRRNRDRETAETMRHALDETALGFWKPELHGAACRRKGASLSQPKDEADREKR